MLLYLAFGNELVHTAALLDVEELLPCLGSDRSGQVLKVVRTRCGVNDLIEVCLLFEEQLLVTCDTLAELCRLFVSHVKRRNGDLIHTCECRTHGLGLRAEEVHIRIEDGHVETAGLGADVHLSGVAESGREDRVFVRLNDLSPQQTACTELSYLHEIVTANTHVETDRVGCAVVRDACLGHHRHVLGSPSECVRELLSRISAGVIEDDGVDAYYAVTRQRFSGFDGLGDLLRYLLTGQGFALEEHVLNRVHVDRTDEALGVITHAAVVTHEDVRQLRRCACADREVDGYCRCINAVEQRFDEVVRQFVLVETETERRDTLVEHLQGFGIRLACVLASADVLANCPLVVCTRTADVGELTRRGDGGLQAFEVLTAVERLHVESFRRAPHQFLIEIGTFQVSDNLVLPCLFRHRSKIR